MIAQAQVGSMTFEEILLTGGNRAEAQRCLDYAKNAVRTYIFSRYPQRKGWVIRRLRESFKVPALRIESVRSEGLVWGYVGVPEGTYALVGIYPDAKTFEEIPERRYRKSKLE
ncbi:MAG: hypothetical protein ACP5NS_01105 [Candidatus Pacearchaeota archaeon]